MKVEAIKQKDGLFIPMNEFLAKIPAQRMFVDIEILEPIQAGDYDALDQLVGLCETGIADASVHHDTRIYTRNEQP
jgi:hypothetical protein